MMFAGQLHMYSEYYIIILLPWVTLNCIFGIPCVFNLFPIPECVDYVTVTYSLHYCCREGIRNSPLINPELQRKKKGKYKQSGLLSFGSGVRYRHASFIPLTFPCSNCTYCSSCTHCVTSAILLGANLNL